LTRRSLFAPNRTLDCLGIGNQFLVPPVDALSKGNGGDTQRSSP
jgi:hypothetical protein